MGRLIDADKLKEKAFGGRKGLINTRDIDNAPTVDLVNWKDFRDFLDDNADDFDRIYQRLDALTKQVSELTQAVGRIEGTHIEIETQPSIDKFDIERVNRITKQDIDWLVKHLEQGKWWLDDEAD